MLINRFNFIPKQLKPYSYPVTHTCLLILAILSFIITHLIYKTFYKNQTVEPASANHGIISSLATRYELPLLMLDERIN